MAVGYTSLVDWPRLTWSLGWTRVYDPRGSPRISAARLAITSFAFMLWDVPAPAWYTSTTNWSRSRPRENLVGGFDDRARDGGLEAPERSVGFGRRLLDEDGRGDEIGGRAQAADLEVLDGARGLDAVVRAGRNLQLAERIALNPKALSHLKIHDIYDLRI